MSDDENCKPPIIRETAKEQPHLRMLNLEIPQGQFRELEGGLLIKDVLALDEGTWTDSAVGTPLFYPSKTLEEYAGNWKQNGFWSRHAGGSPRNITDRVGRVLNPRFLNSGIYVDLFLHKKTAQSRDVADLILAGEINAVSIEHGGEEAWNPSTGRWEAKTLSFYGLASVDQGACESCTIRRNRARENGEEKAKESEQEMDEELKKLLSEIDSRLKAMEDWKKTDSEAKAKADEEGMKKMMAALEESHKKELASYEERIKKLENTAQTKGVADTAEPPASERKAMPFTYKNGEIIVG
jgi:hypothetical protein